MSRRVFRLPDTNVVWVDMVDSTMDVAARLMERWIAGEMGELRDTLLAAGCQTAGRGRGEHGWVSPAGGLYVTWLGWVDGGELRWVPLAAGVAAARAVEGLLPDLQIRLKWPNDLVVAGGKLGGVLCRARGFGNRHWVAVGLGINVASTPDMGVQLAMPARSLCDLDRGLDSGPALDKLLSLFARGFRDCLKRPTALREEWVQRSIHRPGETLRLRDNENSICGAFVGFSGEGQLQLDVNGELREFAAGELIVPMSGEEAEDGSACP